MKYLFKIIGLVVLGSGCVYAISLNPTTDVMAGAAFVFLVGVYYLTVFSE